MDLKVQRRIAAEVLKCSPKKVCFDDVHISEIKEAITKDDIRSLINRGLIMIKPSKEHSRGRARLIRRQKRKGKRRGHGSRKGRKTARSPAKREWVNKVRAQRKLLKNLKQKGLIDKKTYYDLYKKSKGGFFRSTRHIKTYLEERRILLKKQK
ncbi:MAG: 50S ribosomal protein L19e [Candidatus Woesearchaeota archaeon]|nr:50S ribosomal protein L19e [Candidatus Woesearchaeota archaeon]